MSIGMATSRIKKGSVIIRRGMHTGPHRHARDFVAQRLKELRTARSLTQEELSRKARFHATYVGVIERGAKGITVDSLARLCDTLGISFLSFFDPKVK